MTERADDDCSKALDAPPASRLARTWLRCRHRLFDSDGYFYITGRKKEILVTTGGKNVAPNQIEEVICTHPLVSQSLIVGDGKPYIAALKTLDEGALEIWRQSHHRRSDQTLTIAAHDQYVIAEIQDAANRINRSVSKAESVRTFKILEEDFTIDSGELTPTLKVRRAIIMKKRANEIAELYI